MLFGTWVALGELVTRVLATDAVGRADDATERWLAAHRDPLLNAVTRVLSALANTPVVVFVAFALAAAAYATWRRLREPAMLVVALLGELALFVSITAVVRRARPAVPRLDAAPPTSSFPSGHTAASVVLYGAIAVVASERFRGHAAHVLAVALAMLMPLLVGFSRLYRGMHHPTDVLAGAGLGLAWLVVSLHAVRMGVFHQDVVRGRARGS